MSNDDHRGAYGKFIVFKRSHLSPAQADELLYHDPPPIGSGVFVLRYDRDIHARHALRVYAESVSAENTKLAEDLLRILNDRR